MSATGMRPNRRSSELSAAPSAAEDLTVPGEEVNRRKAAIARRKQASEPSQQPSAVTSVEEKPPSSDAVTNADNAGVGDITKTTNSSQPLADSTTVQIPPPSNATESTTQPLSALVTQVAVTSLPNVAAPPRQVSGGVGYMFAGIAQWIKRLTEQGSGGVRPLSNSPGNSASSVPPQIQQYSSGSHPAVSIAVQGPVVALRLGRVLGTSWDSYVCKPFARIHVVDGNTGRYLCPSTIVAPQQAANAPPVNSGTSMIVSETDSSGWIPCRSKPAVSYDSKLYVRPTDTGPALNKELDADLIASITAAVGPARLADTELSRDLLRQDGRFSGVTGLSSSASLVWNEYIVLNCTVADALSASAVILVEILDDSPALPKQQLNEGKGYYRVAWGYCKLTSPDSSINMHLDGVVPLGFLPQMLDDVAFGGVEGAPATPTLVRPDTVPTKTIPLFGYSDAAWSDTSAHSTSIGPAFAASSPSPAVALQYRMRQHTPAGLQLEIAPFAAVIPSCRYIHTSGSGVSLTYFDTKGQVSQQELDFPLKRIAARTDGSHTDITRHPAFSRPNYALALPTDVYLAEPLDLGEVIAPPAPQTVREEVVVAKPMRSRFARGKNELCLLPDMFICSVPTGRLGAMTLSFSPDGLLLAVGCGEDTGFSVKIFQTDVFRQLAVLPGHASIIYQLSWSPNSQWLISSSADATAHIWYVPHSDGDMSFSKVPSKPYSTCLHTPASYVYAAKFHPLAPNLVISGAFDHGLRLWDAMIPSSTSDMADRPLDTPTMSAELIGFIGEDPKAAASGAAFEAHKCHSSHVNAVEFDTVATGTATKRMITADGNGCIMIWSLAESGCDRLEAYTLLHTLRPAALRGVPIVSVKVRPYTNQIMVLGHQNILRLYDLTTYGAVRAYPNARCTSSHLDIAFSPDGAYVACGGEDGVLSVWSVDKGDVTVPRAQIDDGRRALIAYPGVMHSVDWHPDQHMLAVCAFNSPFPAMVCGTLSSAAVAAGVSTG